MRLEWSIQDGVIQILNIAASPLGLDRGRARRPVTTAACTSYNSGMTWVLERVVCLLMARRARKFFRALEQADRLARELCPGRRGVAILFTQRTK